MIYYELNENTRNIVDIVAKEINLKEKYRIFDTLEHRYNLAKKLVYYILRLQNFTLPQISTKTGKDHTSILYQLNKMTDKEMQQAKDIYERYILYNRDILTKENIEAVKSIITLDLKEIDVLKALSTAEISHIRKFILKTHTLKQRVNYRTGEKMQILEKNC